MNQPLVSIIIPTYNRAHLIGETLDSVLAQTYQNWECIIVDDGSTDNTGEVVNSYIKRDARFQLHYRPADRLAGGNAARNYGFERSKGEYVMFFDSDDLLASYCLMDRVSLIINDSKVELLIRDTSKIAENKVKKYSINKDPKIINREEYLCMFLNHSIPWPIMGGFYKRSLLLNCKFDENLKRFQDVSFNIKVLSMHKEVSLLRDYKIDSYYRVVENKGHTIEFINKVLDSLVVFFQIHSELLENKKYKIHLRKFSSKIVLEFIIPYFKQNKSKSNTVLKWYLNSKIYNLKQKTFFIILILLLNFNLFHIKGIGINKFRILFKTKIIQ